MSQWASLRIGDIGELFDGPHATPKSKGKVSTDYIFLSISSLENGRLNLKESPSISEEDYLSWTRRVTPQAQDLVFSYETRLGEGALIPAGLTCCLGRRMALLRPNQKVIEPRFLLYLFLGPKFQQTIAERTIHGSTVNRIALNDFPDFPILLPDITEQRRIAGVLGALDDKIESNRQICSLINLLSEELFCSRFRLRKDCTTKGILTIGDLGEIVGGGTPSKKVEEYYVDSGIAWLTPKDLARDSSTFRHHGAIDISELGLRKSSARLLPRGTVLFTSRAPIGYIAIASGETSTNQGFKSIVPHPEFGTAFTFYLLKQLTPEIVSSANGSTFKEISKGGLASISFDAPDRASVREFNSLVQPLLDLQEAKESETCRLSKLRDALLPELMSGRMRVDEAGRLVSEALDEEAH